MDSSLNVQSAATNTQPVSRRSDGRSDGKALPEGGQTLPAAARPPPTPDRVEQAVQQIQNYLNDTQRQLQFQVDSGSGRTVVRVVNPETNELIRQIPSEEVLKLARALGATGGQIISELV